MNRYQFEDLISAYVENELSLSKRKEFEDYMKNNPDSESLVSSIISNIEKLNQIPKLKVQSSFNDTLKGKIAAIKNDPNSGKNKKIIFGFSPLNASFLSGLVVAFVIVSLQLINLNLKNQNDGPKLVNSGPRNDFTPSNRVNKAMNTDLVDVKDDSLDNDMKLQKRKDLSNKMQFVND